MASISSFHKRRSLEEYRNHINELTGWTDNPRERIGRCFHNVGTHVHNSINSFAEQKNLPKPSPFSDEIKYY
jgi:hypothetical protein